MVLLAPTLLAPLIFALSVSAIPTEARRRHRRKATMGIPEAVETFPWLADAAEETGITGMPVQNLAAVAEQQGHWEIITTSTYVTGPAPTSSAVAASTNPNPISSFVSSSDDPNRDASLGLSICLGFGCNEPSASDTPSTSILPSTSVPAPLPSTSTSPGGGDGSLNPDKQVFAHFMIGIVSAYTVQDHVRDMTLAKSKGITGFALNIGVDPYSVTQLELAYDAAAQVGDFSVFISFDFNWYSVSDVSGVAEVMKKFNDKPAQYKIDGKPFVSSFIGDGFDWSAVAAQCGQAIYAVPFFQPSQENANNAGVSGLFSWAAWPGQLDNQPVLANMTMDRDQLYLQALQTAGKKYMAPVSPWFSTHFGTEVPYSKNWLFFSELLWKTRWDQILQLGTNGVDLVEIVTWNDYGESHHVGPFDTPHTDDGSSKWAKGLDHSAMLDFSVPYIRAFRQGKSEPVIEEEMLVYWYRPHLKSAQCDGSDNCGTRPTGWDMVEDSVFVSTMTKTGGTVIVNSGSNTPVTKNVDAGVQTFQVPMGVGEQSFSFTTHSGTVGNGKSDVAVSSDCWDGIYNYNFHSGSIKG